MKDIQHALGLLFLAILGLLSQGAALTVDHGIGDLNITGHPTQTDTSGAYDFPSGLSGNGGGPLSSALASDSGGLSVLSMPISVAKSHSLINTSTSWTLTTVVDTITTIETIKPSTTIDLITELSTIESTTTKTAAHASTTETLTYVVIVGYSTETIYTTTQLNPPTEIDYTRTLTSSSTSEEIVVPTDVTYTITSLPPTPPTSAVQIDERRLAVQKSFQARDITSFGDHASDNALVSGLPNSMATSNGVLHGNNSTASTLINNTTATLSASLLSTTDASTRGSMETGGCSPSSPVSSVSKLPPFPNTTSTGDNGFSVAAITDSTSSSGGRVGVGSASTTTVTGVWNGRNTTLTEIIFHTPSSRTLVGTSVLFPTYTRTRNATVTLVVVKQTRTPTPTPLGMGGGGGGGGLGGGGLGGTPAAAASTGRPKSWGVRSVAIDVLTTLAVGLLLFARLV